MKRIVMFILLVFIFVSCQNYNNEKAAVSINDIKFTAEELNDAFEASPFYEEGSKKAKQEFLDSFITKRLVLLQAERLGLDRNKEFLQGVQRYWERALFKLAMSRKAKELSVQVGVTDTEIQEYYQKNKEAYADKEMAEVYDSIKWVLLRQRQSDTLGDWIIDLKRQADIDIDYEILGIAD